MEPVVPARLDTSLALRVGQTAAVAGTTLRIRLLGVLEDSRCPEDAVCVWEGDALVRLQVSGTVSGTRTVELHTALHPRDAVVDGYRIALERVRPATRSGAPVPPEDYAASLRVTRAS